MYVPGSTRHTELPDCVEVLGANGGHDDIEILVRRGDSTTSRQSDQGSDASLLIVVTTPFAVGQPGEKG